MNKELYEKIEARWFEYVFSKGSNYKVTGNEWRDFTKELLQSKLGKELTLAESVLLIDNSDDEID